MTTSKPPASTAISVAVSDELTVAGESASTSVATTSTPALIATTRQKSVTSHKVPSRSSAHHGR